MKLGFLLLLATFTLLLFFIGLNMMIYKEDLGESNIGNMSSYKVRLLGWIVSSDQTSEKTFYKYREKFTWVSPVWYSVDGTGYITERVWTSLLIEKAREAGVKVVPLISNKGFSSEIGHKILTVPEIREKVIESIVKIMVKRDYDGINIDFEGIDTADRESLTSFICELYSRLHPLGKEVSIDVPAKISETFTRWSGAYDYEKLSQCVDYLIVMVYDYHWSESEPGPVAPLWWHEKVIQYSLSKVPKKKLVIGIPVYGYDWKIGENGKGISYRETIEIAKKYDVLIYFDENEGEATYTYIDVNGDKHVVWFNTAQSTHIRLEIARKYGIDQIAFWRVGMEDPEFWSLIERKE